VPRPVSAHSQRTEWLRNKRSGRKPLPDTARRYRSCNPGPHSRRHKCRRDNRAPRPAPATGPRPRGHSRQEEIAHWLSPRGLRRGAALENNGLLPHRTAGGATLRSTFSHPRTEKPFLDAPFAAVLMSALDISVRDSAQTSAIPRQPWTAASARPAGRTRRPGASDAAVCRGRATRC
jgi:hypothetical protein